MGWGKEAVPSRWCRSGQYPESLNWGIHHIADFQAQWACVDWPQQQYGKWPTSYSTPLVQIGFQTKTMSFFPALYKLSLIQVMLTFSQTGGRFKWVDNWRLSYTKWGIEEPKNNYGCVYMDVDRTWKTASCTNTYYSLCKRSPGQTIPLFVRLHYILYITKHRALLPSSSWDEDAISCLFFRYSTHWAPTASWQLSRTKEAKNLDTFQRPLLFLPQLSGGKLGTCLSWMLEDGYALKNVNQWEIIYSYANLTACYCGCVHQVDLWWVSRTLRRVCSYNRT